MTEPYKFLQHFEVRSYECDVLRRLKLSYLMRFLQHTSTVQVDQTGLTHRELLDRGQLFLLSRAHVVFEGDMPRAGDALTVATWPGTPHGATFPRYFELWRRDDTSPLAQGVTLWALVDPRSKKILRPSAFPPVLDTSGAPLAVEIPRTPFPLGGPVARRPVRYSDIDLNGHVNNTVYGDMLCDFAPAGLLGGEFASASFQYLSEALPGDVLDIFVEVGDGAATVAGSIAGKPCFIASLTARR